MPIQRGSSSASVRLQGEYISSSRNSEAKRSVADGELERSVSVADFRLRWNLFEPVCSTIGFPGLRRKLCNKVPNQHILDSAILSRTQ